MKKFYVYTLSDKFEQVFYIGKGSRSKNYDRINFHIKYWKHHQRCNKRLFNKIKKLDGRFIVNIIFESDNEACCFGIEKKKIAEIRQTSDNLCNLTDGGEGTSGWKHTTESKNKMSLNRDADISRENIKKAVEINTGKRKADMLNVEKLYETKSIYQIKAMTGLDYNTIKKYLDEKGLYIKNKNRQIISDDGRVSMGKGQRARTDRKRVSQCTTKGIFIQSWNCAQNAVDTYGSCVRDCLRGRQKTAYGYIWKYE
jgi:hypothetical protein